MSADTTPGLAPCPFCGAGEHRLVEYGSMHNPAWAVLCAECEGEGPQRKVQEEAATAWNCRAPALASQGPTDAEIEALASSSGARWNGSYWVVEDADLHPFIRAVLARWGAPAASGEPVADTREVVSDEDLAAAFAGKAFGEADPRQLLHTSVLKKACGYHCGHTITAIMQRLGLIGVRGTPTTKGQRLMQLAYHALMVRSG